MLGIRSCPVNWPIGVDGDFQGVYHRDTRIVELYTGGDHGKRMVEKTDIPVDDPLLENILEAAKRWMTEGVVDFDMCRGDERYKKEMGGINEPLCRIETRV